MRIFNEIRQTLMDPSAEAQAERKETERMAGIGKGVSGLVVYIAGTLAVVSLIALRNFPIIGALFALIFAAVSFMSYEGQIMAGNLETMMGSVVNRVVGAWSEQNFTNRITAGTLVVGPLFGTSIARELAREENSPQRR